MFGQYSKEPPSSASWVSMLTVYSLVSKCQGCSMPGRTTLSTRPESGSASSYSRGSPKQSATKRWNEWWVWSLLMREPPGIRSRATNALPRSKVRRPGWSSGRSVSTSML